ncbi:MAG TPA: Fur family transcriptional regulator [Solirubrobacterales bacterium]|jgi:Fur family ferric uptake transcriptional regulator|nr:Fur family transcriptional regulator [Solirubrobacterales bacterium]
MTWAQRAEEKLDQAGYRSGSARRQVIELLEAQQCALTALEMDKRLAVGRASIYRTLEQLEQLRLIQRIDVGGDAAGYERLDSDGHHHHLVCRECGLLAPFADPTLERAIESISRNAEFEVDSHDVVLRGRCPRCQAPDLN